MLNLSSSTTVEVTCLLLNKIQPLLNKYLFNVHAPASYQGHPVVLKRAKRGRQVMLWIAQDGGSQNQWNGNSHFHCILMAILLLSGSYWNTILMQNRA